MLLKRTVASIAALLVMCGVANTGISAFAETPYTVRGTLYFSEENDYISYNGRTHELKFKKTGWYSLVKMLGTYDRDAEDFSDISWVSLFDSSLTTDTWADAKKATDQYREFRAGETYSIVPSNTFFLLYTDVDLSAVEEEESSEEPPVESEEVSVDDGVSGDVSEDTSIEDESDDTSVGGEAVAVMRRSVSFEPICYKVIADKLGVDTTASITCRNTANTLYYAEFEFTVSVESDSIRIASICFTKDGSVSGFKDDFDRSSRNFSFKEKFYSNGSYTAEVIMSDGVKATTSFNISGLEDGAIHPIGDGEDTVPPNLDYSVSPNRNGLGIGEEVTVTITSDEPCTIQFNGTASDSNVTSWSFPVYANGTYLATATDNNENGSSITVVISNFGDGTTDTGNGGEGEEQGNPLDDRDKDEFWENVGDEGAYDSHGRRLSNSSYRDTRNRDASRNLLNGVLPQTGIKSVSILFSIAVLGGGLILLSKSKAMKKKKQQEAEEDYKSILDDDDDVAESNILDEIFGETEVKEVAEDEKKNRKKR